MDGSAVFAFDKSKRLLLVKRRDVPVWVIPGGGIEKGETPEEAAVRETKEETGFAIKIVRKVAEYTYKGQNKKNHIFEAVVVGGKAETGSESKEITFFEVNNLPELRHPSISEWLSDWKKGSRNVIQREIEGVSAKQALSQIHKHPLLVIRFLLTKLGIRINT
ncbi:NUDIX domain-containing protein [Candidatus Shapirobacteria bacterium]|nr:NUDIX domain-containing protein [Candidatus Shapirobacteria bacterium]